MFDAKFNPSLNISAFFGDLLGAVDNERFLLFLKAYYEWLQTTKITYTGLSGTFVRDEIITGSLSGATAVIKQLSTGQLVVKATSNFPFENGETITGGTSDATATIGIIKDNVVRASGQVLDNRTIEKSVDVYTDYLREELYESIPKDIIGDKRLLALKFKDFFQSRSNEDSYRFLFRLIYDEPVEFYYPGEDVLRVSDGNFEKTQVIRAVVTSNIFDFAEKTIRGETSGSLANVVDIKTFFIGSVQVAEMTLKLVSDTFVEGETIVDIDDETLTTTIYGMVTGFTINDGGSGYEVGDTITITGDGSEAEAVVSSIKDSPISALKVNTVGQGYRLNANATINNSGTGGSGLIVRVTELANTYSTDGYTVGEISKVSVINRGEGYYKSPTITLQDSTIVALGLLSPKLITITNAGTNYGVGNTLVFTGGAGANAAGKVASVVEATSYDLLFEDGFRMLSEDSYDDIIKNEDWAVLGAIKRIELTNFGSGYTSANLPSISVSTTTGANAVLTATDVQGHNANVSVDVANNITGIGSIRAIEIKNFGVDYTTANAYANTIGDGNANLTPIITGLGIKEGNWINDDGKIDYKYIQDSYFYQDFSYVIKSGLAFVDYGALVKQVIHPSGLQVFGEILLLDTLNVSMSIASTVDTIRDIQTIVVSIISFFEVGIVSAQAQIKYEIKVESADIDTRAYRLEDEKEYTLILPYTYSTAEFEYSNTEMQTEISMSANTAGSYVATPLEIHVASEQNHEISTHQEYVPTLSSSGTIDYQGLTEYQIESSTVNEFTLTADSEFEPTIESYALMPFSTQDETNKYLQITGTVSSSTGTQYKDLPISAFANIAILAISSDTFETAIPAISGTGTTFLTDFSIGDIIATRDEYFTIVNIFTDTSLVTDRDPATTINNVAAFKRI